MAGANVPTKDELEALRSEVAALRADLKETRLAFLELPPAKYREFLNSYTSLQASDIVHHWLESVALNIVAAYTPPTGSPSAELFTSSQRVLCPLCGLGGQHIYGEVGFIYPEGLRRHLTGEVTARLCPVVEAALALAKGHIEDRHKRGHV
jgi:hypothetical protein